MLEVTKELIQKEADVLLCLSEINIVKNQRHALQMFSMADYTLTKEIICTVSNMFRIDFPHTFGVLYYCIILQLWYFPYKPFTKPKGLDEYVDDNLENDLDSDMKYEGRVLDTEDANKPSVEEPIHAHNGANDDLFWKWFASRVRSKCASGQCWCCCAFPVRDFECADTCRVCKKIIISMPPGDWSIPPRFTATICLKKSLQGGRWYLVLCVFLVRVITGNGQLETLLQDSMRSMSMQHGTVSLMNRMTCLTYLLE